MVLKWSKNVESIIQVIEKQARLYKKMHMEISGESYFKYSFFMISAIVISPLPGLITTLGTLFCKEISDMVYYNSSAAVLSFLTTIIVSIIKFNKYDEEGYAHKSASFKYVSIEQNVKRQLMLSRSDRISAKQYVTWLLKSFDNLYASSPPLSCEVIKKYEKLVEELERELDENEERMSESEEKENEERQSKYSSEEKATFAIKVEKQPKRVKKKHDDFSSIFDMSKYDDENMLYELEIK
jgi:hypothetical protein